MTVQDPQSDCEFGAAETEAIVEPPAEPRSAETVAIIDLYTPAASPLVHPVALLRPDHKGVCASGEPGPRGWRWAAFRAGFFMILFASLVWGVVEVRHLFSIERQPPRTGAAMLPATDPSPTSDPPGEDTDSAEFDIDDASYLGLHALALLRTHVKQVSRDHEGRLNDAGEGSLVELGDSGVIAPQAVTVVNLWATWCSPCRAEFGGFQKMFILNGRDQGWGPETRFVPILVDDAENGRTAYTTFGNAMPAIHAPLIDLKLDKDGVRGALQEVKQIPPNADLPVTLLFDCRRRIRWSKIGALDETNFDTLADEIDKLRAELRQDKCKIKRRVVPTSATPSRRSSCSPNEVCGGSEACSNCPRECRCKAGEKCVVRPDGLGVCLEQI